MTLRQLIDELARFPLETVAAFAALPLCAWLFGRLHGRDRGGDSPWKYGYAVLIYVACIPGILGVVLWAYTLFFTGSNMLDLELTVFFVPPVAMIATLLTVKRSVEFEKIPGFDRLSGLMVVIGLSFVIALAVTKLRIWLVFGSSIASLFVFAALAFVVLHWATKKVAGRHS